MSLLDHSGIVVELVDFKYGGTLNSSNDQVCSLINMLKMSLRNFKKFSLNFDKIGTLEYSSKGIGNSYDLVVSYDYGKIILNQGPFLRVYDRSTLQEFNPKLLFELKYKNSFRCMKLIRENGVEFIYATNESNNIVKIQVSDIMKKNNRIIWKSKAALKNAWGLDILENCIHVVQFDSQLPIAVLDRKRGKFLKTLTTPSLPTTYGIHMFSEKEMLLSHSGHLEILEKKNDSWESTRKSTFSMKTAYSIYYEESSNLIYISDSSGNNVHAVNRQDLSIVKSMSGFKMAYGLVIDKMSGLLYVIDTPAQSIIVFQ